jgi:hypothetical protein
MDQRKKRQKKSRGGGGHLNLKKCRRGHGCLCLVSVMCCQAEVSATGWSLVQKSHTECGVCKMWPWSLEKWGGLGPQGAVEPLKNKVQYFRFFRQWTLQLLSPRKWRRVVLISAGPQPDHEHSGCIHVHRFVCMYDALLYIYDVYTCILYTYVMYASAEKAPLSGPQNQYFNYVIARIILHIEYRRFLEWGSLHKAVLCFVDDIMRRQFSQL